MTDQYARASPESSYGSGETLAATGGVPTP